MVNFVQFRVIAKASFVSWMTLIVFYPFINSELIFEICFVNQCWITKLFTNSSLKEMRNKVSCCYFNNPDYISLQSKSRKDATAYAFRLKPGEDRKEIIEKMIKERAIKAGWVATCVGSLPDSSIRFANQPEGSKGSGHFEIVSLMGTISINGSHLHISISDSTGKTIGGHLM